MALSDSQLVAIVQSDWFQTTSSPYLVLDHALRIRAANIAFERATGVLRTELLGKGVVTRVLCPTTGGSAVNQFDELHAGAAALHQSSPSAPRDEILGVLAHSQLIITDTLGSSSAAKAQQLAKLRLELQTGFPAIA